MLPTGTAGADAKPVARGRLHAGGCARVTGGAARGRGGPISRREGVAWWRGRSMTPRWRPGGEPGAGAERARVVAGRQGSPHAAAWVARWRGNERPGWLRRGPGRLTAAARWRGGVAQPAARRTRSTCSDGPIGWRRGGGGRHEAPGRLAAAARWRDGDRPVGLRAQPVRVQGRAGLVGCAGPLSLTLSPLAALVGRGVLSVRNIRWQERQHRLDDLSGNGESALCLFDGWILAVTLTPKRQRVYGHTLGAPQEWFKGGIDGYALTSYFHEIGSLAKGLVLPAEETLLGLLGCRLRVSYSVGVLRPGAASLLA